MSSSPEQSDAAGNLPHNTSTTSVISALSVSGGESPPGASHTPASALMMTPHLGHLSAASSTPNSPHLSSRPSSGKHSRGKSKLCVRVHCTFSPSLSLSLVQSLISYCISSVECCFLDWIRCKYLSFVPNIISHPLLCCVHRPLWWILIF